MIHIATVHWELDVWIDIQLKYFNRHIQEPFRVYAYLNRLKQDHSEKFFYSSTEDIESHAVKLNLLADHIIAAGADDSDLLVFIDGDAFPVGDMIAYGRDKLQDFRLIAVQRQENFGDIQPHPSFCMTTVGFWKEIEGDWNGGGYTWKNLRGEDVYDVGGNLLGQLRAKQVDWYPILRSNKVNLHPLFFGIYGDVVYHHGAGFRKSYCRLDAVKDGKIYDFGDMGRIARFFSKINYKRRGKKTKRANRQLAGDVFKKILSCDSFYEEFR